MCTMVVVFGGWHLWTSPYIDTPQERSLHPRITMHATDFEWYAYSILVSVLTCS